MGSLIAFAYIGVMLAPPLVSLVVGFFGMGSYPVMLFIMFVIMASATALFVTRLRRIGKFDRNI